MKTMRAFLFWALILCGLAVCSVGLVLYLQWPLWTSAGLFCAVVGVYLLGHFLWRLFLIQRSRSRLARQDRAARRRTWLQSPERALVRRWKAAVRTLRSSGLRRNGDALYALPWYMVVGRSGSGKTTALTRSRLNSPIQKIRQDVPVPKTESCDWFFFDKAVLVDLAGRFVECDPATPDDREWNTVLDQLAKYRHREGLNGLVIAIDVQRLQAPQHDALIEEGRILRDRIQQLIQLFDKRFPVYVLVTKCDLVYGLEGWAQRFPREVLNQAMGYLADDVTAAAARSQPLAADPTPVLYSPATGSSHGKPHHTEFLSQAFRSIGDRLRMLRLLLGERTPPGPEVLLFPQELERLEAGLKVFLKACFAESPYLETPLLRGLFFSSGLQEGGATSVIAAVPPVPQHTRRDEDLFLRDFFGRVLPEDRCASRPVAVMNSWRATTRRLGATAWLLLCFAAAAVMTAALIHDIKTIKLVRDQYSVDTQVTGDITASTRKLETLSNLLARVDARNNTLLSQWLVGATALAELEDALKADYVRRYRADGAPVLERTYYQDMRAGLNPAVARRVYAGHISNLVRYINILEARKRGADRASLERMPWPASADPSGPLPPSLYPRLRQLSLAHIAWTPRDDGYLREQVSQMRHQLTDLAYHDAELTWLRDAVSDAPPLTLPTFWRPGAIAPDESMTVPAAMTAQGRTEIDALLDQMEHSVEDKDRLHTHRRQFDTWYEGQRMAAWLQFVKRFPEGQSLLRDAADWQGVLEQAAAQQGPYERLLDRVNHEFASLPTDTLPPWLSLARQYGEQRGRTGGQTTAVVDALNARGGQAIRQTLAGAPEAGVELVGQRLKQQGAILKFHTDLDKIIRDALDGPAKSYTLAASFHATGNDPDGKPSSIKGAFEDLAAIRSSFHLRDADSQAVWQAISGSLDFAVRYVNRQASCILQKDWEKEVLWPKRLAPTPAQALDQLYGPQGTVWTFVDGSARPFLQRTATRFSATDTMGYQVPLADGFLPMLNSAINQRVRQLASQQRGETARRKEMVGLEKAQLEDSQAVMATEQSIAALDKQIDALRTKAFVVSLAAQPTNVNEGAQARPFSTTLSLQCASGIRTLSNFNFRNSETFNWQFDQCGDTTLTIRLDGLNLTRTYPGAFGFVDFLNDFRSGSKQFAPVDFPRERARLDQLGLSAITVRYDFTGQDALRRAAAELAQLERQRHDSETQRKRVAAFRTEQAKQLVELKEQPEVDSVPLVGNTVPQRVGACWGPGPDADRSHSLAAIIEAMSKQGAR